MMSKGASARKLGVKEVNRGRQIGSSLLCTHPHQRFLKKKWIGRIRWSHL